MELTKLSGSEIYQEWDEEAMNAFATLKFPNMMVIQMTSSYMVVSLPTKFMTHEITTKIKGLNYMKVASLSFAFKPLYDKSKSIAALGLIDERFVQPQIADQSQFIADDQYFGCLAMNYFIDRKDYDCIKLVIEINGGEMKEGHSGAQILLFWNFEYVNNTNVCERVHIEPHRIPRLTSNLKEDFKLLRDAVIEMYKQRKSIKSEDTITRRISLVRVDTEPIFNASGQLMNPETARINNL